MERSAGSDATAPLRVLVADDNSDFRELVRAILRMGGKGEFSVVGDAANGADVVRLSAELKPDALLLDLSMPGMDGPATISRIRAVSPSTGILILSGHDLDGKTARSKAATADGYLVKGAASQEVIAAIRQVVSRVQR